MIVNEIVNKIKFQGSLSPIKDLNKNIKSATSNLKDVGVVFAKIGASVTAVVSGIALFTNRTMQSRQNLINLSEQIGVSTDRVQQLGYIASQTNSSFETIESTLSSLADKTSEALISGDEGFARLGVSVLDANGKMKKADEVLLNIRDRFRDLGLTQEQKIMFANNLGIDRSLIDMLSMTDKQFDSILSKTTEFDIISPEKLKQAEEYNRTMSRLKTTLSGIAMDLAVRFTPVFEKLAKQFAGWVSENKDFIVSTAKDFGNALKTIISVLLKVGSGIKSVIDATVGMDGAIKLMIGGVIAKFIFSLGKLVFSLGKVAAGAIKAGKAIGKVIAGKKALSAGGKAISKYASASSGLGVAGRIAGVAGGLLIPQVAGGNSRDFERNLSFMDRLPDRPPASAGSTNNSNTSNNISISVQGNNPNDIAQKTMQVMKQYFEPAETQNRNVLI